MPQGGSTTDKVANMPYLFSIEPCSHECGQKSLLAEAFLSGLVTIGRKPAARWSGSGIELARRSRKWLLADSLLLLRETIGRKPAARWSGSAIELARRSRKWLLAGTAE